MRHMLDGNSLWLAKKELHNTNIKCQIQPRTTCQTFVFMIKINSNSYRLLAGFVNRNTIAYGMSPFKITILESNLETIR